MITMFRPEVFPGTASMLTALESGATLPEADVQTNTAQAGVFGRRRFSAHKRALANVIREQELAEFRVAFEASL